MFQILPVFGAKIQIFSIPRNWIFMFWSFSSTLSTILIPNSWFYSVYSCNPTFDPDPVLSYIAQHLANGSDQIILNWNLFNGPYLCEIDFRCKRPTANLYMDKPKETHSTHSNNNSQFSPYHRGMAAADTSRALSRREYHFTSPNVALYALHLFNFNALLRFLPRHFPPIIKISRSLLRAIHYSAIYTLFFRP